MSEPIIYTDPAKTTNEQIIAVLREHAGINPDAGLSRTKLIKLCRENGIMVDETKPVALEDAPVTAKRPTAYVINIAGGAGKREVIVGVNGKMTQIQTDVDVTVKPEILEVLRNAKQTVYEDVRNELGQLTDRTARQVPRHSVSVIREVF